MTLWKFPDPWDYHEQGAYVIAAESREDAIAALEAEAARTGAEYAAWEARKEIAAKDIQALGGASRFQTPEWKAWTAWLNANPMPFCVRLPEGYTEDVEMVGLVYVDGGCDD